MSLRGQLSLDQSRALEWGTENGMLAVVSRRKANNNDRTYLSIYVTFLKNHKNFNSSISLKYLLLSTDVCACVCLYVWTCEHLPSFHQCLHEASIFPNLREGIIFEAGNRWYSREFLQTMSPLHFLDSSAIFYLKKEEQKNFATREQWYFQSFFSGKFSFHLIQLFYSFIFESLKKLNLCSY